MDTDRDPAWAAAHRRQSPRLQGFTATPVSAPSQGGKGGVLGGGGAKGASTQGYAYSVDVLFGLCEGPIDQVNLVWNNKTPEPLSSLNLDRLRRRRRTSAVALYECELSRPRLGLFLFGLCRREPDRARPVGRAAEPQFRSAWRDLGRGGREPHDHQPLHLHRGRLFALQRHHRASDDPGAGTLYGCKRRILTRRTRCR